MRDDRATTGRARLALLALPLLLGVNMALAQDQGDQRVFATPEAAGEALVEAFEAQDRPTLTAILGQAFADLAAGQGAEANDRDRQRFIEAARQSMIFTPDGANRLVLTVGLEAWPLPAPLVKEDDGWRFDGEEGVEVLADRLVGRNELAAIAALRAYVDAQVEYASEDRDGDQVLEYAQRMASTSGTHDGLYWPVGESDPPSPFGPFLAEAGLDPDRHEPGTPYYGYHYRIMTRQGENVPGGAYDYVINGNMIAGFAMVAWPARYGESGVMTFVVNQSGIVLERDMGERTEEIGPEMVTYNPDATWKPVED
jgi:hypothetical protein